MSISHFYIKKDMFTVIYVEFVILYGIVIVGIRSISLGFFNIPVRFCFSRNITTVNKQTAISFPFNEKNFNCLIERPC